MSSACWSSRACAITCFYSLPFCITQSDPIICNQHLGANFTYKWHKSRALAHMNFRCLFFSPACPHPLFRCSRGVGIFLAGSPRPKAFSNWSKIELVPEEGSFSHVSRLYLIVLEIIRSTRFEVPFNLPDELIHWRRLRVRLCFKALTSDRVIAKLRGDQTRLGPDLNKWIDLDSRLDVERRESQIKNQGCCCGGQCRWSSTTVKHIYTRQ